MRILALQPFRYAVLPPVLPSPQLPNSMSISKTRQKLVDVARDLFARQGLDATTMNDIAQASQKGRRTLYTYFRNKEEIYDAVIESELEVLSERMDEVAAMNAPPEEKLINMIYTHLCAIKEVVARNGSLRAEFFKNIWLVERKRKAFDEEEIALLQRVIEEGCRRGTFNVEYPSFTAEIIHYSVKGIEVPYIYDRLGRDLNDATSRPFVAAIVCRALGMSIPATLQTNLFTK